MCHFISWLGFAKNRPNDILYLTYKDYKSSRGQRLVKESGSAADFLGHGMIRKFYKLHDSVGIEGECEDFKTTKKFPPRIVRAMRDGEFIGLPMYYHNLRRQILTAKAYQKHVEWEVKFNGDVSKLREELVNKMDMINDEHRDVVLDIERLKLKLKHYKKSKAYRTLLKKAEVLVRRDKYIYKQMKTFNRDNEIERKRIGAKLMWDLFSLNENRPRRWRQR